jgi:geranylgeranyl diphosphate synthase type I
MTQLFSTIYAFQKIFMPHLEDFLIQHQTLSSTINPITAEMAQKLEEFTLRGGKRIRSALLYFGYQCFSDENLQEVLKLAITCELMQSFLLIHDDIMDEAELRRGGKTIHKIFSESINADARHGESLAILMGNLAGYLGIKAIASTNFDEAKKCRIMELYAQICIDVGYGQALDLTHQSLDHLSEEYIYNIYRYKTARYTTEFPLVCAAFLTAQNINIINSMQTIGSQLGILFQIQDDILGVFGDSSEIGKSTLSDIAQGKKTLLIYKAWQQSNKTQKSYLAKNYGNKKITSEEVGNVCEIIKNTNALLHAQNAIKKYAEDTKTLLNSLRLKEQGKKFIEELLNYYMDQTNLKVEMQPQTAEF